MKAFSEKAAVQKLKTMLGLDKQLTPNHLVELGIPETQLSKYAELLKADRLQGDVIKYRDIEHLRAVVSGYGAELDNKSLSVRLVSKGRVVVFYPTKNKWVYDGKGYKGLCSEFVSWLKRTSA